MELLQNIKKTLPSPEDIRYPLENESRKIIMKEHTFLMKEISNANKNREEAVNLKVDMLATGVGHILS